MRYLFTITFLVLFELGAFPKALSIDTTFQPFFDIRCCGSFGGRISDLWEDPTNGKLFIVGDFRFGTANKETHLGITSMSRDGSRNYQFKGCCNVGMDAFGKIVERPGNSLMLSMPGGYVQIDKSGKLFNKQQQWQWVSNKRKTFECNPIAYNPYFFLMVPL